MERLKQTISRLEKEVDELKEFHKKSVGIPPSTGDVHYCTSSQEFGEYALDEMDTFNFTVNSDKNNATTPPHNVYIYTLINPTPELSAYLNLQGKSFISGNWCSIKPDDYEEYCMEQSGTPFVLTKEIRACLESKLWKYSDEGAYKEFIKCPHYLLAGAQQMRAERPQNKDKSIKLDFSEDITISFKNTYKIFPHVSFYITPILNTGITCSIKEITTKQVTFTVVNNSPKEQTPEDLKLHYQINGIVEQSHVELLN